MAVSIAQRSPGIGGHLVMCCFFWFEGSFSQCVNVFLGYEVVYATKLTRYPVLADVNGMSYAECFDACMQNLDCHMILMHAVCHSLVATLLGEGVRSK